jgi:probable phosphoglycerate mutase
VKVIVEADGGSRGNPGPAGYGAVVFDSDTGAVLAERKEGLGATTNNVAEYKGLIAGLAAARDLGAGTVAVRMDSKLVVEQMSGRWQVKHPAMQPLNAEAKRLVADFDRVTFEWIPRERNKHADRLANEAMDEQAGVERPVQPTVAAGNDGFVGGEKAADQVGVAKTDQRAGAANADRSATAVNADRDAGGGTAAWPP